MRTSTTAPITLHDVPDPENHPYIIEGQGDNSLKIYFETEENKHIYEDIAVEHPGDDFETNLSNPV